MAMRLQKISDPNRAGSARQPGPGRPEFRTLSDGSLDLAISRASCFRTRTRSSSAWAATSEITRNCHGTIRYAASCSSGRMRSLRRVGSCARRRGGPRRGSRRLSAGAAFRAFLGFGHAQDAQGRHVRLQRGRVHVGPGRRPHYTGRHQGAQALAFRLRKERGAEAARSGGDAAHAGAQVLGGDMGRG